MLNCPYFREQGGSTPRCAEFRENSRRSVCLPACRGRWATLAWLGGGVRSDDVGDYRTMAFIKSIAFTPSVMGFWPMTAPPTQGSLFLCPGRRSVDFCCSGIVTQRAGHAHAPTLKNGSAYRPSSVFASQSHLPPGEGYFVPRRFLRMEFVPWGRYFCFLLRYSVGVMPVLDRNCRFRPRMVPKPAWALMSAILSSVPASRSLAFSIRRSVMYW